MDEFQDEETFKKLNEREVTAWLEVKFWSLSYISVRSKHSDNFPTSLQEIVVIIFASVTLKSELDVFIHSIFLL